MIPDAIEREILIEAPVETVWRVVTEPCQIGRWFADAAELDAQPGGDGVLIFEDRATNEQSTVRLRVEAADPPYRLAFRWDYQEGEEPGEHNSPLVEFVLSAEGAGTRLRVVESGFTALRRRDEDKAAYLDVHAKGWDIHMSCLRDYCAREF